MADYATLIKTIRKHFIANENKKHQSYFKLKVDKLDVFSHKHQCGSCFSWLEQLIRLLCFFQKGMNKIYINSENK